MIPRIAWVHWASDGPPMSWLRKAGLESFRRQNPDWDLRVVDSLPEARHPRLCYAHRGDWTGWAKLAAHGGFVLDADIIHLAPMRDAWLEADLCAQVREDGSVHQMAALGAAPGHPLMVEAAERCATMTPRPGLNYQAMGVHLLKQITSFHGPVWNMPGEFARIPREAFCAIHWEAGVCSVWNHVDHGPLLQGAVVGIHWYGGHWYSRDNEHGAQPNGNRWLEHLACKALSKERACA